MELRLLMNLALEFPHGTVFYRIGGDLLAQTEREGWMRVDQSGRLIPVSAPRFQPLPTWELISETAFRSVLAQDAALPVRQV